MTELYFLLALKAEKPKIKARVWLVSSEGSASRLTVAATVLSTYAACLTLKLLGEKPPTLPVNVDRDLNPAL